MFLIQHESLTNDSQETFVSFNYVIQVFSGVHRVFQLLPRTFQNFKVDVVLDLEGEDMRKKQVNHLSNSS